MDDRFDHSSAPPSGRWGWDPPAVCYAPGHMTYVCDPNSPDDVHETFGSSLDHLNRIVERISPDEYLTSLMRQPERRDTYVHSKVVPGKPPPPQLKVVPQHDSMNDSAYETFYGDSSGEWRRCHLGGGG